MNCTKHLISVVMDGIKDANMCLDYYECAMKNDMSQEADWFKSHAKHRIESLSSDYDFVKKQIDLDNRIKSGDDIAESLDEHIEKEIAMVESRYESE